MNEPPTPKPALLRLVGSAQTLTDSDDAATERFYGNMIPRLAKEVRHTGDLSRYVAFQDRASAGRRLHFLGLEVERITDIPLGMIGWELSEDALTVLVADFGDGRKTTRQPLKWAWRETSAAGRVAGEFTAAGREFHITGNSYVCPSMPAADDEVRLVDYDPAWPDQFIALRHLLARLDPAAPLILFHYGSTAIPGMPAKPVVDALLEVPSTNQGRRWLVPLLNSPEWEYWWYSDHMVFVGRSGLMGPRIFHLHAAPRGHPVWRGLEFRDYLRAHPDDVARYAALKRDLAAAHAQDREKYTLAKTEFVEEILAKTKPKGT